MAIITNQATLDAERVPNSNLYTNNDVDGLTFENTALLTLPANSMLVAQVIASDNANADVTIGDGSIINFTTNSNNAATDMWRGGTLIMRNSSLVASHASGNHQWPGFTGALTSQADPPTYIFTGCRFSNTGAGELTNHFGNASVTGCDLSGATFLNGGIFAPWQAFRWVNTTFSGDFVDDAATDTGNSYMRLQNSVQDQDGIWAGHFGCNMGNWTADGVPGVNLHLGGPGAQPTNLTWYLIDNTYSADWLTGQVGGTGTALGAGAGFRYARSTTGTTTGDVIVGRSWNPLFYQRFTDPINDADRVEVTDIIVDFGATTDLLFPGTTVDQSQLPTRVENVGQRAIYTGNNRPSGIVILEAESSFGTTNDATQVVAISDANRTYNYWSYTHMCYNTMNGNLLSTPTAAQGTWNDLGVMNNVTGVDTQNIDLAIETLLNNNTLTQAQAFVSGGLANLNDVYAMGKSLAYDNRLTNFALAGSIVGNIATEGEIFFSGSANSLLNSNNDNVVLRLDNTNTLDLNGGTFTTSRFRIAPLETYQMTLTNGTAVSTNPTNATNVRIGANLTIGGVWSDVPTDVTVSTIGSPEIDFLDTGGVIDITASNITGMFTPGQALTVTAAQALSYFGATIAPGGSQTINGHLISVPAEDPNTFTLSVPSDFRGRLALAHRINGRAGSGAFTLIGSVHDFTTATHPTVTINDADATYGRGGTNTPVVITVGPEYRLQVQDIIFPAGTGIMQTFTVNVLQDQNYTAAIRDADISGSNITDMLVSEDGTSAGHIVLNISGASGRYDIAQTAKLLAACRDDVDYMDEVLQGGRTTDFISVSGSGTVELDGLVTFQRLSTETTQQFLEGVDFVAANTTFVATVAGCNDVIIFPARTGITPSQVSAAVDNSTTATTVASLPGDITAARDAINLHTTGNISTIESDLEIMNNTNLQRLNDNVRIASVKPGAVQTAQGGTADLTDL